MRFYFCNIVICLFLLASCLPNKKSVKQKKYATSYYDPRDSSDVGVENGEKPSDMDADGVADIEDVDVTSNPRILVGNGTGHANHGRTSTHSIITKTLTNNVNRTQDSEGLIAYSIPDRVRAFEVFEVVIRVGRSTATVNITSSMEGTVKSEVVQVSNRMEAKLVDPSASINKMFEIVPNNAAIQIIEENTYYTEWSWNVTALRAGKSYLTVVLSIIRGEDKRELVFKRDVEVQTNNGQLILIFIGKYWQWVCSSVLIPLIIFAYKRFKKQD